MSVREEFYVGYLPQAPLRLDAWLRVVVLVLLGGVAAVALALTAGQAPFGTGTFEFGDLGEFEGRLEARPYPTLVLERPGADGETSRYLLVGAFKSGADADVAGLDGRLVRLQGTLVYRDDRTMVEVVPGSVTPLDAEARAPMPPEDLGQRTLRGEIVDSKCFLGVMNPGHTKVHRGCAARCISGGIPPALLVRHPDGTASTLLLAGPDGRMVNREVLQMIAEPIQVKGIVERHGDLLVLRSDPATYVRLPTE